MKIKETTSVRNIAGEYIMIGERAGRVDYTQVISLNETAYFLINSVGKESFTQEHLVNLILENYDGVGEEQAREDVQKLVESLESVGVLES